MVVDGGGWWMVYGAGGGGRGGGWWMMMIVVVVVVVVVDGFQKGSQILLKILSHESSQHINLLYFGKSAKNFFYRKKIRLQVSKSGVFSGKKCSANFLKILS